ncbi:6480_t:CDS:2 [Entrophospora sp. SA101]|nr:6480_t:CDS:2 [Entrophospora sp. SA101]
MSQPPRENNLFSQVQSTISQSDYNIYSDTSAQIKIQQLANLQTVIQQKEEAAQQEEYLKKQAETLEQAEKINQQLEQARANLSDRIQEEKKASSGLDNKLTKLPTPSEEELDLLSQLSLTMEQFASLASQAQYLTHQEKEEMLENFPTFPQDTKLQLINSGLNNLEINTLEKKEKFIELNQQLHNEKANFGLTTPEKENILRLLITSLDLSQEQRTSLEQMEVSSEQANSLLSFGCQKIQLTEEQQINLINTEQLRNFSLTEPQKNILQSLAPLTREDKYSPTSLNLLKSLNLKPKSLSFLVNEEILPNPNLDFGEVKSPYLPLKIKLLAGEQKALEKQAEIKQKQLNQQQIEENKQSIILSLAEFAEATKRKGLKTVPKYNFFELLIFAVENFTNTSFAEFLVSVPQLQEDYQKYLANTIQLTPEEVLNNANETELREQFAKSQAKESKQSSSRYDNLFANLSKEEAERERKKLEREQARKKLEDQERQRRKAKLSDKDRKLQEDAERRQKEKELAELEDQEREEARLAREKALREEQDAYFATKTKNLAERKKATEQLLADKKKENELEEQKKKDQIAKLEKENQEEQERLIKQSNQGRKSPH